MVKEYPDDWRVTKNPICLRKIVDCYRELKNYDEAIEVNHSIITDYPDTDFAKAAELNIKVINEYFKKGKEPTEEEIRKMFEEAGLEK